MKSYEDRRRYSSRSRLCYLTREDETAFWTILKDEFPDLIVCRVDADNRRIIEFESLADAPDHSPIYLPNRGWKPKFGTIPDSDFPDMVRLLNGPYQSIGYIRPRIRQLDNALLAKAGMRPPDRPISRFIGEGSFQSAYRRDKPEEKIFVTRVFNLIGKFMTNCFEIIDLETRETLEIVRGSILWAAPDARRRSREEENFFIYTDRVEHFGNRWVGAKALERPRRSDTRSDNH